MSRLRERPASFGFFTKDVPGSEAGAGAACGAPAGAVPDLRVDEVSDMDAFGFAFDTMLESSRLAAF